MQYNKNVASTAGWLPGPVSGGPAERPPLFRRKGDQRITSDFVRVMRGCNLSEQFLQIYMHIGSFSCIKQHSDDKK